MEAFFFLLQSAYNKLVLFWIPSYIFPLPSPNDYLTTTLLGAMNFIPGNKIA